MELEKDFVPDNDLISSALSGDHAAFEQLFMRYRDEIYQLYMQKTGNNVPDANDMMQETFIRIFVNLHKFDPEYTFRQWLYTIARNVFIDHTRRRKDFIISLESSENYRPELNPPSETPTPEQEMISSQTRFKIDSLLETIPDKYKDMIRLRFINEYSYEEISVKLSIPIGTVKTHIHRAREIFYRLICENGIR
ncbi:MAG: RNA polymerase sigma factor [Rikenellaceae bacterium]|nr:RNA polymerase sigma factor [Rikenellaceae bacterium]